jgi:hypothetical protein
MATSSPLLPADRLGAQALGHIRSTADFAGLLGVLWGAGLGALVALNALSNFRNCQRGGEHFAASKTT